jgi:hypothetical protein
MWKMGVCRETLIVFNLFYFITEKLVYMKRNILLKSFLLSVAINLAILLIPSISSRYKTYVDTRSEEMVDVDFYSLPGVKITEWQSISIQSEQMNTSGTSNSQANAKYMTTKTYKSVLRELALSNQNPAFNSQLREFEIKRPDLHGQSRTTDSESSRSIGSVGKIANINVTGSGKEATGYYNISLVRYEDTSDNVSPEALTQLAGAMNKWTKVKTKVIQKPLKLDDPILDRVPLIYITSKRPFAFSERERENLRRYFSVGGFMIFSNTAENETASMEVANSIGFELWKILGEPAHNLSTVEKKHPLYNNFFDLQKTKLPELLGITISNRIVVIYEDTGYANAWISGKDDSFLKMGVNIIAYALATNSLSGKGNN